MTTSGDDRLLAAAHDAFRAIDESLGAEERKWLDAVPPLRMIDALDAYPPEARLIFVSPEVEAVIDEVTALGGERWAGRYLNLVLVQFLVRTLAQPPPYRLPPPVDELVGAEVMRILDAARKPRRLRRGSQLDWSLFDLGLARGTMLPFGILLGQLGFALAPDILACGGLDHLPGEPWLHMHLRPSLRGDYSPAARAETYVRVAEFLVENPPFLGAFGVGWLFDPAVAEISPHLSYVRAQFLQGGALLFRTDTAGDGSVEHATSTSKTRRRLYEAGRYTPTDYAFVWLRDDLIRWADTRAAEWAEARC